MTSMGQRNFAAPPIADGLDQRQAPSARQAFYNNIYHNGLPAANAAAPNNGRQTPANTDSFYFPTESMVVQQQPNRQPTQQRAEATPYNPVYDYHPQLVVVDAGAIGENGSRRVVSSSGDGVGNKKPSDSITDFSWNIFKVIISVCI